MKKLFVFLTLFCVVLLSTGCVNLSTKYVAQQRYALSVKPASAVPKKTNKVLEIYYPNISEQFAGSSFVYRSSKSEYTSDFYNTFFTSPADQINQNLIKYLQAARIYKYASDDVAPLKPDYILKTNVTEFYADYRDKNAPKAVISIQFVLLDVADKPKVIMNKTLHASILLQDKNSTALINALNKGLGNILRKLVINLR